MKITVPYDHDPTDLGAIQMGISQYAAEPTAWKHAYRDTVDGQRIVWARFHNAAGKVVVWIRDRNGARIARTITV